MMEMATMKSLTRKILIQVWDLERLAVQLVQDVDSIFDVDTIKALRDEVCELAGAEYIDRCKRQMFPYDLLQTISVPQHS